MRHFESYGAKHVLMWCPSCNEHYDEVVAPTHGVPFPYEHVTAFIARHLDRIRFVRSVEKRVVVHYHTGYPQSDSDWKNTLRILEAIPGVQLVAIPHPAEMGRHCTPKWISRIGRPRWSQVVRETLESARQAEVDVVATIYHSVIARSASRSATTRSRSSIGSACSARRWGSTTSTTTSASTLGDPEAVFAEVEGHVRAHGLDPARVRGLLDGTFAPACHAEPNTPS